MERAGDVGNPVFLTLHVEASDSTVQGSGLFWYYATADEAPVFDLACIRAGDADLPVADTWELRYQVAVRHDFHEMERCRSYNSQVLVTTCRRLIRSWVQERPPFQLRGFTCPQLCWRWLSSEVTGLALLLERMSLDAGEGMQEQQDW